MTLLLLGIVLWSAAHAFKRVAPGMRADLTDRFGAGPAKGFFAVLIGVSVLAMILGFRGAPFTPVYTPPSWAVHVNNLLMLGAIALMGMGQSKGRARAWLRHPMLTGFAVWAAAHLLVNGDVPSFVLFGGLGIWALVEMAVINRAEPRWTPPAKGAIAKDAMFLAASVVLLLVIGWVHTWLGYPTFG